jgi:hypothetical protein
MNFLGQYVVANGRKINAGIQAELKKPMLNLRFLQPCL